MYSVADRATGSTVDTVLPRAYLSTAGWSQRRYLSGLLSRSSHDAGIDAPNFRHGK